MKKTITLYELLGLIKDGKAPKKIKYENREYYLYDNKSYLSTDKTRFFDRIYFCDLNIEVEILDEEEFEDIEILVLRTFERTGQAVTTDRLEDYCDYNFEMIENIIAKMVLNQKKIIERLKESE